MRMPSRPSRQHGVALAVALMLLIVITLLALAGVRYSTVELRMAVNEEMRVAAFQMAQSVVDATISDPDNTPVKGAVGATNCTAGITGCTNNNVQLPSSFSTDVSSLRVQAKVERKGPELGPPPRGLQTSLSLFGAAYFEVQATYDRTADGRGRAQINEGLILLVPSY